MSDPFIKAMAPALEKYRNDVLQSTWGHLAPRRNVTYREKIVFALGIYGSDDSNPTVLKAELVSRKYGDLADSPWFFEAMIDFLQEAMYVTENYERKQIMLGGNVYQFEGTFKNYVFEGKFSKLLEA